MFARYLLCGLGLCVTATVGAAQQAAETDLKTIMQGLRDSTVAIVDAMLVDDLSAVAEAAEQISEHPRIPPDQVTLVAAELGPEMAAFKQFDTVVHDLSVTLGAAAEDADRVRMQKTFEEMIAGCFGCHAAYRQRVMSALASQH